MGALKKNPGPLTVLIDSQSSLESITRVLKKEKREVSISQNGEEITIEIGPLAN
jgi:hypothetical protein